MRIVPGDQDVARFATETLAHPVRRIAWLQVARRRKLRKRIARAPESLGGLFRTKLPAMPDDVGLDASGGGVCGKAFDILPPPGGERPLRIDVGTHRIAVMHED